MMDPLNEGKSLYAKKDFQGALEAFTKATKYTTGHILLDVFDHRAATHVQLGDLDAALADSRRMLELKPLTARGYLRAGKVLVLRKEHSKALKIYERGLEKVKFDTDEDRTLLQKIYEKLRQKYKLGKCCDPLEKLPPELAEMVCHYLETRDRVLCLSVSRGWKKFIEGRPTLWESLDLRFARRVVTKESLKAWCKRSESGTHGIRHAAISLKKPEMNATKLRIITQGCKRLSYLHVCYDSIANRAMAAQGVIGTTLMEALPLAKNLSTLVISADCQVFLSYVVSMLKACPKMERAEFHNIEICGRGQQAPVDQWPMMPNLKKLKLSVINNAIGRNELINLNLTSLIKSAPNAEWASINGFRKFPGQNVHLDFRPWTKLAHLDISLLDVVEIPLVPDTLTSFDISAITSLTGVDRHDPDLKDLNLPRLRYFSCAGTICFSFAKILALVHSALENETLTHLDLGNQHWGQSMWGHSTNEEFTLPQYSSTLKILMIPGIGFSEERILAILRQFPNLRSIDLSRTTVTGVVLRELVDRESSPTDIVINQCSKMSSDAVEWARKKGVNIQYIMLKASTKRARYL